MLTFRFTGADGIMVQTEILTSGMVGKEVKLEFSRDWEGMSKTAVFRAGTVTRIVTGVKDAAVIPAEVLARPLQRLYVGVYGVSADGSVTPTIRAEGPDILPGVEPSADRTAEPELPVWAQLDQRLKKLEEPEPDDGTDPFSAAVKKIRTIFANIMTIIEAQVDAEDGVERPQGYSMDISGLKDEIYMLMADLGDGESADTPVSPSKTLSSITAVYHGGDVPAGTAVSDLSGIVVTAHYSDGTSETVSGYTLSGIVAEGSNTITVSYAGMTAAFTVTGTVQSGDDADGVTSISYVVTTELNDNDPENGYRIRTDTSHTAYQSTKALPAWPLIAGKTYSITVTNITGTETAQYWGLWVSTLNIVPVKGEVNAVTDTIVQNLDAWTGSATEKTYTYTAGQGEYLIINVNAHNSLRLDVEVKA